MHRSITTLGLLLASAYSWGQANIALDLSGGNTFTAGQTVSLNLVGSGWTSQNLAGGGLDLVISNSSVFTLESATINTSLFDFNNLVPFGNCAAGGSCAVTPSSATNMDFAVFNNSAPTGGPFEIASFTFLAASTGTADLNLSADCACNFSNSLGTQLVQGVDYILGNAAVSVTSAVAAPEIDASSTIAALTLLFGILAVLRGGRGADHAAARLGDRGQSVHAPTICREDLMPGSKTRM